MSHFKDKSNIGKSTTHHYIEDKKEQKQSIK